MDDGFVLNLSNTDPALRQAWHPIALLDEVGREPSTVWLLGEPWSISSAGGALPRVVSATGDPAAHTAVVAGMVWIAPEPPLTVLPDVAGTAKGFVTGVLTPTSTPGCAGAMLDNFLDVAHFPFVHAGTFGTDESDKVDEYEVTSTETGFLAITEHTFANHEDPAVAVGSRPLLQRRRMTYDYTGPFSATLRLDYVEAGGTNLIVFAVQPEAEGRCRVYTTIYRNDIAAEAMPEAVAFEERVLAEDLVIQSRMPPTLPLDLTTEVHTRADRVTIQLRRTLADFIRRATPRCPPARTP